MYGIFFNGSTVIRFIELLQFNSSTNGIILDAFANNITNIYLLLSNGDNNITLYLLKSEIDPDLNYILLSITGSVLFLYLIIFIIIIWLQKYVKIPAEQRHTYVYNLM